ncbi:hypothetical protein D6851_06945 [Altericroceibacterium spongiae]|uniref:Uncharacterized protein n=1 Tax=Altericroceibacterium spongiae TaxID=2320269 RepID=A0A420EMB3_9SPHN|nr:hypothetical protein D6851_06945 [Altericroceibacterium spongiae]
MKLDLLWNALFVRCQAISIHCVWRVEIAADDFELAATAIGFFGKPPVWSNDGWRKAVATMKDVSCAGQTDDKPC